MTTQRVRYRRASDALWRVVGQRTYVTRPDRSDFELLMGIGSQAWRLLGSPIAAEDLASGLSLGERETSDLNDAVKAMLDDLEARGVIVRTC